MTFKGSAALVASLAFLIPATALAYLLLIEWMPLLGTSIAEAYAALPPGYAGQIRYDTIWWLALSGGCLAAHLAWRRWMFTNRPRAHDTRILASTVRPALALFGLTSVSSFVLWAHVDLAFLRLGRDGATSHLIGWVILAGVAALIAWAVIAVVGWVRASAHARQVEP